MTDKSKPPEFLTVFGASVITGVLGGIVADLGWTYSAAVLFIIAIVLFLACLGGPDDSEDE